MSSNGVPALDDGIVLSIRGVGKCYEMYSHPSHRLMQSLMGWRRTYYREFWALRDVSFDVSRGECVGIVGQNGAGKSTLLQIATGILAPTTGMTLSRGRVVSMLELGSGFNPEFTGRENVYLNASLLGLSQRDIDARFDQIAAFADIGQFMDSPVKHYSSGMFGRLAFAVYSSLDPQILIIDEILSVGDAKFQAKCFRRIRELREGGTSILLVSHSSEQIIQHCERAVLLHQGKCVAIGKPRIIINQYVEMLFGKEKSELKPVAEPIAARISPGTVPDDLRQVPFFRDPTSEDLFATHGGYNQYEHRWGNGDAHILDFYLHSDDGRAYPASVEMDSTVTLYLKVLAHRTIEMPVFGLLIKTKEGLLLYGNNSRLTSADHHRPLIAGQIEIIKFKWTVRYNGGDYLLSVGLASGESLESAAALDRRYDSILLPVLPSRRYHGLANMELTVERVFIAGEFAAMNPLKLELISLHVPKCAGTSLRDGLVRVFGEDQIYFDNGDRLLDPASPVNTDRAKFLREFDAESILAGKRAIHGHFCLRKYDAISAPRFTILREPVDRLISHYLFWGHLPAHGHSLHERFLAEKPSIVEFAKMPSFRHFYRDVMFRDVDMKTFDLVGRVEAMDAAIAGLEKLIGKKIVHENTNINGCDHCREFRGQLMNSARTMMELRDLLRDEIAFYEKCISVF